MSPRFSSYKGIAFAVSAVIVLGTPAASRSVAITARVDPDTLSATPTYPTYRVVDLGTLGGGKSWGYAINNSGQIAGVSWLAAAHGFVGRTPRAFLYQVGIGITDIYRADDSISYGYGINDLGQVTGALAGHAFIYSPTTGMRDIGAPEDSAGVSINGSGRVAGWVRIRGGKGTRAFVYAPEDGVKDIGTLRGPDTYAYGINDRGEVTGWSDSTALQTDPVTGDQAADRHAFVYTPSAGMKDIGLPLGGWSEGHAINNAGQVAGYFIHHSGGISQSHAFLYTPQHGILDLNTFVPGEQPSSEASALNQLGQVVGSYSNRGMTGSLAFLYTPAIGVVALNRLLPSPVAWALEEARGINDRGEITGWGTINGATHAFLLLPTNLSRS